MKFSKVLCAVDNDPLAESTFDLAFDLSKQLGAEFALVSVIDTSPVEGIDPETYRRELRKDIDQLFARLLDRKQNPNVFKFYENGSPKSRIVEVAKNWEADLIVIASHARTGIARALMGSVSESVLRHSNCPVLIVPAHR